MHMLRISGFISHTNVTVIKNGQKRALRKELVNSIVRWKKMKHRWFWSPEYEVYEVQQLKQKGRYSELIKISFEDESH